MPFQPFESGALRGFLHSPPDLHSEANSSAALALTHGAGGNCDAPLLVAVADSFAAAGMLVLRFDLPFRTSGRGGAPRPADQQRDREGIRDAILELRNRAPIVYAGGHSYGGRQTTMLAAELASQLAGANPSDACRALPVALLLLSYPLHPPQKPARLRTAHFPNLRTPALFISGARDGFSTPAELQSALRLIPARTRLLTIDAAGHDLGFAQRPSRPVSARFSDLPKRIVLEFLAFIDESAPR